MGLLSGIKGILRGLFSPAEDPRQGYVSIQDRQTDRLRRLRDALQAVSTSKQQLEAQTQRLRAKLPELEQQAREALVAGREDMTRLTLQRRRVAALELERLEDQVAEVAQEEQRLALAEQRLAAQIEAFRTRQEVILARYTAAEAQVRIQEALSSVSEELTSLGVALEQAEEKTEHMQARASAIDELMQSGVLPTGGIPTGDAVDQQLSSTDEAKAVEQDLEALKREVGEGRQPK